MKRLFGNDKMAIVEYGLIVALIAVAGLTVFSALGPKAEKSPPAVSNAAQ